MITGLFENLKADAKRYQKPDASLGTRLRALRTAYGLRATAVHRFGRWIDSTMTHTALLPVRWTLSAACACCGRMVGRLFGIHIDRAAVIGSGLYIGHFGGVYVGPCRLGENCSIHQHVRIGPDGTKDRTAGPTIGSNVWIGPHTRITEPVTIGNGVTVAAGAVVVRDVEDGCLVLGNPARVTGRNYDNTSLLRGRVEDAGDGTSPDPPT